MVYSVIKFRKYKLSKAKGWVGKEGGGAIIFGPKPGYCITVLRELTLV